LIAISNAWNAVFQVLSQRAISLDILAHLFYLIIGALMNRAFVMGIPANKKIAIGQDQLPKTWWQWVILYPAVFLAIITAVPQWVQLALNWNNDIPLEKIEAAKSQSALFKKNLTCTTAPLDAFYLTPKNVKVDATICASGDVFVRMITPENAKSFYWVDVDKVVNTEVGSIFTSQAFAAELPEYTIAQNLPQDTSQGLVICQRFLDDRNLLRVVNLNGACFDEVVDTFMGVTVSQVPSLCRSAC
jgi:hypothetical protein